MRKRRIPQRLDQTDVEIIRMLQADARRRTRTSRGAWGRGDDRPEPIERLTREGVVQCGA
jgi:hypothetical protein